jgi:predicted ribosome quality control (RQC) complex YloA/Tae2 family protein
VVENAERLYRKAKGQQQDMERLQTRATQWKETLDKRSKELESLRSVQTWAELKPFLSLETSAPSETANLPYHLHRFMDYEIWVGKNAKANDEILRLAHKDDLWLHARDVTGSHVIVRNKKGKTTPQPVLERAAEMAAFYSKAKSESLSPVMVTERKYVRKGKNMLPGQVRVEKEKTLIVSPRE